MKIKVPNNVWNSPKIIFIIFIIYYPCIGAKDNDGSLNNTPNTLNNLVHSLRQKIWFSIYPAFGSLIDLEYTKTARQRGKKQGDPLKLLFAILEMNLGREKLQKNKSLHTTICW